MCRINEYEGSIIDPPNRVGTVKKTKSRDYDEFYKNNSDGITHDMLQYTLRMNETFKTTFED